MFRVGQKITLKAGRLSRYYRAKHGDVAKVRGVSLNLWATGDGVDVGWVREGTHTQDNGTYPSKDFELVGEQQLLFDFMRD